MAQARDAAENAAMSIIPESYKVSEEISAERFAICKACDLLYKPTHTCKKCGCFMLAKTQLARASCPIGKWVAYKQE